MQPSQNYGSYPAQIPATNMGTSATMSMPQIHLGQSSMGGQNAFSSANPSPSLPTLPQIPGFSGGFPPGSSQIPQMSNFTSQPWQNWQMSGGAGMGMPFQAGNSMQFPYQAGGNPGASQVSSTKGSGSTPKTTLDGLTVNPGNNFMTPNQNWGSMFGGNANAGSVPTGSYAFNMQSQPR